MGYLKRMYIFKYFASVNSRISFYGIRRCSQISRRRYFSACNAEEKSQSLWESVVGLEIHAQINAQSKLFSPAATVFNAPTNTQVSYFDAALPGTLPVCNKYCVEAGILTALALNCTVHKTSSFDRKHYFYPDLPAGYQITQQFNPLATNGHLEFYVYDVDRGIEPYKCKVRLKQIQLEQDSGRSFHVEGRKTLIDLNRAGIGLMELVFEPDLKNGLEASMLVKELALILRKLKTCSCAMEEGALRVDANISVNKIGEPWGVRTEVKNINSNKYIAHAIDFEIKRQIELLEKGEMVFNETRSFDFKTKKTVFMRDKENFQDYRFFPEPNLPPLHLCDNTDEKSDDSALMVNIDDLKINMPSLPSEDRSCLMKTYGLSIVTSSRIVADEGFLELFKSISEPTYSLEDNEAACLFLLNKIQCQLNSRKQTLLNCRASSDQVKGVFQMMHSSQVSEATANDILEMMFNGDQRSAKEIVDAYNWYHIADDATLETLCQEVMKEMPKVVKRYRNKKQQRHMTSLLAKLNLKVNNRASVKKSQETFIRLIGEGNQPKQTNNQPKGIDNQPEGIDNQPEGMDDQPEGMDDQPEGMDDQPEGDSVQPQKSSSK